MFFIVTMVLSFCCIHHKTAAWCIVASHSKKHAESHDFAQMKDMPEIQVERFLAEWERGIKCDEQSSLGHLLVRSGDETKICNKMFPGKTYIPCGT
jgi:hypothetical protein